jgi:hypothetical protein
MLTVVRRKECGAVDGDLRRNGYRLDNVDGLHQRAAYARRWLETFALRSYARSRISCRHLAT